MRRLLLSLVLGLALLPGTAALAQTPQQARQELRAKLVSLLDQWEAATRAARDLQQELSQLEGRIAAEQSQAKVLRGQEAELAQQLEGVRAEEGQLRGQLQEQRQVYYRHLRLMYLLGLEGGPSLLASAEDFAQYCQRLQALSGLLAAQHRRLDDLKSANQRLGQVQQMLSQRSQQLARLQQEAESSRRRLTALRGQRRGVLSRLQAKRLALIENIGALKQAEERLARTFALPGPTSTEVERHLPGVLDARGHLTPPVRGRLLAGYGSGRRGVTIKAQGGAVVRAPWGGRVAHAGHLNGFGQVVVLDHGQGVHTVLAHLGRISVQPGQELSPGEEVGRLDADGRLYLEVRLNARPVDPRQWLRLDS
ncbi:MAG: peptidoglycan DD-metalloendopeptidase family protein [Thermodesulfobacteriota bacterium]